MAEDKPTGGLSLSMVPILESGANWVDFNRRIEEYLVMSGLGTFRVRHNASEQIAIIGIGKVPLSTSVQLFRWKET